MAKKKKELPELLCELREKLAIMSMNVVKKQLEESDAEIDSQIKLINKMKTQLKFAELMLIEMGLVEGKNGRRKNADGGVLSDEMIKKIKQLKSTVGAIVRTIPKDKL